jgi:hypothetical protein
MERKLLLSKKERIAGMKKLYVKPVVEQYITNTESLLNTDSTGKLNPIEAGAKENNLIFDEEVFGDTWGEDSNNLWGDEE